MNQQPQSAKPKMITSTVMALILVSVVFSALAQILLKSGMSTASVQSAIAAGGAAPVILAILGSFKVWLGLFLYGSSAVSWLFVLSKLDVSVAYPFVAIGFILTMILGCTLLGEPLTARKVFGTVLVSVSIYLIVG